ncbi:MAG: hypothetical protein QOK37_112 [Thermoanaerobaculia bacterium]|jgi:hypothetical protein|nr:hypothetical protein [Thermoanaerobaculia bacterium]
MSNLETIRSAVRRRENVTPETLKEIDAALDSDPSAALWILRGDAIQLSNGDSYDLADVEQSYQRGIELAPSLPEPYESLGYFYFAVMDDAAKAKPYFEHAIALGGGESAASGLQEAVAEIRDRAFQQSAAKINRQYAGLFQRLGK